MGLTIHGSREALTAKLQAERPDFGSNQRPHPRGPAEAVLSQGRYCRRYNLGRVRPRARRRLQDPQPASPLTGRGTSSGRLRPARPREAAPRTRRLSAASSDNNRWHWEWCSCGCGHPCPHNGRQLGIRLPVCPLNGAAFVLPEEGGPEVTLWPKV